ncbi:hypothetical protein Zm00014a_007430 [Zea mays]|uniref:Uncharacterized protein n=1 Tax=Zea mays TaxID=4577 RepID=A0A3L6E794_MAIZE|nr:hypothetical protein Zm00014a_007430 [Zea mays]
MAGCLAKNGGLLLFSQARGQPPAFSRGGRHQDEDGEDGGCSWWQVLFLLLLAKQPLWREMSGAPGLDRWVVVQGILCALMMPFWGLSQGLGASGGGRSSPFLRDGRNSSLGRATRDRSRACQPPTTNQGTACQISCIDDTSKLHKIADPLLDCLLADWETRHSSMFHQPSRIFIDPSCLDLTVDLGGFGPQSSNWLGISTASRDWIGLQLCPPINYLKPFLRVNLSGFSLPSGMVYGGATTVKIFYQRRRKTTAGNNIATINDDDNAEAHALRLGLDVDVTAVTPSDPPSDVEGAADTPSETISRVQRPLLLEHIGTARRADADSTVPLRPEVVASDDSSRQNLGDSCESSLDPLSSMESRRRSFMAKITMAPSQLLAAPVLPKRSRGATKHVTLFLKQVLALDKRYLDPRRSVNPTQQEKEEGIIPLTDSLPIIPQVLGLRQGLGHVNS